MGNTRYLTHAARVSRGDRMQSDKIRTWIASVSYGCESLNELAEVAY
jgi:hypothetical protein